MSWDSLRLPGRLAPAYRADVQMILIGFMICGLIRHLYRQFALIVMPWQVLLSPLLYTTPLSKDQLIAGPTRSHLSLVFMHSGSFHTDYGCSQAWESLTLYGQTLTCWGAFSGCKSTYLTIEPSNQANSSRCGSRVPVIASLRKVCERMELTAEHFRSDQSCRQLGDAAYNSKIDDIFAIST